jgi:hypothetical protein
MSRRPHPKPHRTPQLAFFEDRRAGRGIFKWRHYFEIYDRYFSEVNVLEIGSIAGADACCRAGGLHAKPTHPGAAEQRGAKLGQNLDEEAGLAYRRS